MRDFQQTLDVGRAVSEIAIHRDQRLVPVSVGVADAFLMSAADSELAGAVNHTNMRKLPR